MRRLLTIPIIMLSIVLSAAVSEAQDPPAKIFEEQCAACHTIGDGPAVGPDLKGVTTRQSREWLASFILDPQKVIDSGDAHAKQLVAAADGFVMPPAEGVTPQTVSQLIDYIEAQSGGAATNAPPPPPERPLTDEDVARGRLHFTGRQPLAAGGPPCIACHNLEQLAGFGGGKLAPDLTHVYARLQGRRGLRGWLSSPPTPTMREVYSTHKLTPDEIDALTALFERADASSEPEAAGGLPFVASGVAGAGLGLLAMMWVWRSRFRAVRQPLVGTGAAGGTR